MISEQGINRKTEQYNRPFILPNPNMYRGSCYFSRRMVFLAALKQSTDENSRYGGAGASSSSSDTEINKNNLNTLDLDSTRSINSPASRGNHINSSNSDSNFMIVVAILLCVLLFAWILRSLLRCFWSGGSFTRSNHSSSSSSHGNTDLTQIYLAARVPNFSIHGYGNNGFNSGLGAGHISGMKKRDVRSLPIIFYSKSRSPKSPNVNLDMNQNLRSNPSSSSIDNVAVQAMDNRNNSNNIPAIICFATSTAVCAICLSDFVPGDALRVLPACRHCFHLPCIDSWLLAHSTCPTCRHNPVLPAQPDQQGLMPCIKSLRQQSDDHQL